MGQDINSHYFLSNLFSVMKTFSPHLIILMTCLLYNVLVLQGETRCLSLLGIARLERFSIECLKTKTT